MHYVQELIHEYLKTGILWTYWGMRK